MNELSTTHGTVAMRNAEWRRLLKRADDVLATPRLELLRPEPIDSGLPQLAQAIREHLTPISLDEAHQAFLQIVMMMGLRTPDERVAEGYVMIMVQYPRDLLQRSLVRALSTETYHKLPTPGALCRLAEQATQERRQRLANVQHAMARLAFAEKLRTRQRPPAPL